LNGLLLSDFKKTQQRTGIDQRFAYRTRTEMGGFDLRKGYAKLVLSFRRKIACYPSAQKLVHRYAQPKPYRGCAPIHIKTVTDHFLMECLWPGYLIGVHTHDCAEVPPLGHECKTFCAMVPSPTQRCDCPNFRHVYSRASDGDLPFAGEAAGILHLTNSPLDPGLEPSDRGLFLQRTGTKIFCFQLQSTPLNLRTALER
jgi:hypothetical protein